MIAARYRPHERVADNGCSAVPTRVLEPTLHRYRTVNIGISTEAGFSDSAHNVFAAVTVQRGRPSHCARTASVAAQL
jgi:hypothetical protein